MVSRNRAILSIGIIFILLLPSFINLQLVGAQVVTGSTNVTSTNVTSSSGPLPIPLPNETISVNGSTTVAGVHVFGNGTITTSVNGVAMSFFFDPNHRHTDAKPAQTTGINLNVNTYDLSGNEITGVYIELQDTTGKDLATGYSPASFPVTAGKQYIVYANNYQNISFNHWDNSSTDPARPITVSQTTTVLAFYSTGSSTAPQSPTGLTASAVSSSQINLSWSAPSSNGGSPITGYKVERSIDGGSTWSTLVANTGSASTTYSDTGLQASTSYWYRVSAINSAGTGSPSNTATATTSSAPTKSFVLTQSGLLASDSLTNETESQQQLQSNPGYWTYTGDAPNENAPYEFSRDTSGLHIGVQAPKDGTYAGFFAESPNTNEKLSHSVITTPIRALPTNYYYNNGMYVQTANGLINYVTCVALTNDQATVWAVISTTGNTNQATTETVWAMDNSANQPLTRDCTIITNGSNYLKVYLDGALFFSGNNLNLQMPAPFNVYLEPETSYAGQMLVGSFTDYYVTSDETVTAGNLPSNAATLALVNSAGTVLNSSKVSGGSATLWIGQYHLPLSANLNAYDSSNNIVATSPEKAYGGDTYAAK